MRAAYIESLGGADQIRFGQLPEPEVGPADVLVRVEAVAVDPVDLLIRSGTFRTPLTFPFVLGRDLVGTVVASGREASAFRPGERVWSNSMGHGGRQGAFAERVAVPADRLYPLPGGADPVQAVAVFHPAATAHIALEACANLTAGESLFVNGGAGNVGRCLITFGAELGARVLAGVRASESIEICREAGASKVLDTTSVDLYPALAEVVPDGLDVHVDTSRSSRLADAVGSVGVGGRILIIVAAREASPVEPGFYTRDIRILGFVISRATKAELAQAAGWINRRLATGALALPVAAILPLSRTRRAHEMLADGVRGRIVLRPDG
jgi:NADPH:quinone reductase-like Zn-dependent oxidoreductase